MYEVNGDKENVCLGWVWAGVWCCSFRVGRRHGLGAVRGVHSGKAESEFGDPGGTPGMPARSSRCQGSDVSLPA